MKRTFTLLILCFSLFSLQAQTTADFEDFTIDVDTFLNGSDMSGGFRAGNLFLPNDFNPTYGSWQGWAISNTTDVTTPGFMNQYSSISGGGNNGSSNYAVTFAFSGGKILLQGDALGGGFDGFFINNGTYGYLSMKEGDSVGKKFGGVTGDDPDFLLVTFKKFLNGELSTDSVNFYLADYRFSDNSMDYIVDEWTYLDLSSLGDMDSLSYSFSGSDIGMFGLNTPAYFCMDDATTADMSTSLEGPLERLELSIFPNPTSDFLLFDWRELPDGQLKITDLHGRQLTAQNLQQGRNRINVGDWPAGTYVLWIQTEKEWGSSLFTVQR
ncbi:MAG: DUF4465 domain-containing protein [Bacteroidota bacterium]